MIALARRGTGVPRRPLPPSPSHAPGRGVLRARVAHTRNMVWEGTVKAYFVAIVSET